MIQLLVINDRVIREGPIEYDGYEFNVTLSDSPLHAFNTIIHINPDAIILNIANTGPDGWQIYKRIRNMQASKQVPVLLCVKQSDEQAAAKAREDGVTGYYVAPITKYAALDWVIQNVDATQVSDQKKIMLVDDDSVILDVAELYLGGQYRVSSYSTAADALTTLKNGDLPDVIVLDIAMPEMDGKNLYKAIRAVQGCENIPILFQTGMAGINTVKECMALGASGFVIKPIQKSVLLDKVYECLYPEARMQHNNNKVFVFEELDFMRSLIKNYLKDDFIVEHGDTVVNSLNKIESFQPMCCIVDFDTCGYAVNRIRERATDLRIPLVLLSRNLDSAHFSEEISKPNTYSASLPLNKEKLIDTIKNVRAWRSEEN